MPPRDDFSKAPPLHTATTLRNTLRTPPCPFCIETSDGRIITVTRLLRVLSGKRITGQGSINGDDVLVKLFIGPKSRRHLQREEKGIHALAKANLSTPRLLDATSLKEGGHVLLTEFLHPAETLQTEWAKAKKSHSTEKKMTVLSDAIRLLETLHTAGLWHSDLHLGNFIRHNGTVFIIDGDAIKALQSHKPLPLRKKLRNLAELLAISPDDQASLLAAYKTSNSFSKADFALLQKMLQKIRHDKITQTIKKSFRNCTRFSTHHCFSQFSSVLREQEENLAQILKSPDQAIEKSLRLKDGNSSTVSQVDTSQGPVVVKRYNLTSRLYAFRRLWRPSRAWNSWKAGVRLLAMDIQTPEPLGLIENRLGPLRRKAWIINAFCAGTPLTKKLNPKQTPSEPEATALLSFFNTLHSEQISHGDFKASNLLWHENQIWVIDLDSMKKHRFRWTYARAWKKDRERFLRNWEPDSKLHQWLDANLPK